MKYSEKNIPKVAKSQNFEIFENSKMQNIFQHKQELTSKMRFSIPCIALWRTTCLIIDKYDFFFHFSVFGKLADFHGLGSTDLF